MTDNKFFKEVLRKVSLEPELFTRVDISSKKRRGETEISHVTLYLNDSNTSLVVNELYGSFEPYVAEIEAFHHDELGKSTSNVVFYANIFEKSAGDFVKDVMEVQYAHA